MHHGVMFPLPSSHGVKVLKKITRWGNFQERSRASSLGAPRRGLKKRDSLGFL